MRTLKALCEAIRIECVYGGNRRPVPAGFPSGTHPYRVTLRMRGRQMTVDFFCGPACGEPDAADVLSCLLSDVSAGEQSFEDFCGDMGYDPDSRTAEATWRACAETAPKLRRFLGDSFDAFCGAEQ